MKKYAMPMASPGRSEKFPMPLMTFLRSNGGSRRRSRSRGRSNSSPMFVQKNTTSETQEPSSPTVTCMGQVRVRRPRIRAKTGAPVRCQRRCWGVRAALFCHRKINPKCNAFWRKWVLFFKAVFRSSSKIREESLNSDSKFGSKTEDSEKNVESMAKDSPPKNALVLTRCRSAPHRSSSLRGRLWKSPLKNSEPGEEIHSQIENPTSRKDSIPDEELAGEQKSAAGETITGRKGNQERGSEECAHPLILTRCKSAPARRGEEPAPERNWFRKRKIEKPNSPSLLPRNLWIVNDLHL